MEQKICRICLLDLDIGNNPNSIVKIGATGQRTLKIASELHRDGKFADLDPDRDNVEDMWLHSRCRLQYIIIISDKFRRPQKYTDPPPVIKSESENQFNYRMLCVFCGNDASPEYRCREYLKAPEDRNQVKLVKGQKLIKRINIRISHLEDDEIKDRILNQDLVAVSARYHERCYSDFGCDSVLLECKLEEKKQPKRRKGHIPVDEDALANPNFDFESLCFFCGNDASDEYIMRDKRRRTAKRVPVVVVQTDHTVNLILEKALNKHFTKWHDMVKKLLEGKDLIALRARYHEKCRCKYIARPSSGRPRGRKPKQLLSRNEDEDGDRDEDEKEDEDESKDDVRTPRDLRPRRPKECLSDNGKKSLLYEREDEDENEDDVMRPRSRRPQGRQRGHRPEKRFLFKNENEDEDDIENGDERFLSYNEYGNENEDEDENEDVNDADMGLNSDGEAYNAGRMDTESVYTGLACVTCLTRNRTLIKLIQYRKTFYAVSLFAECDDENVDIYVCWECLAVLKRIKDFQDQVQMAQKIMADVDSMAHYNVSLSKLTVTQLDPVSISSKTTSNIRKRDLNIENNEINKIYNVNFVNVSKNISLDDNQAKPDEFKLEDTVIANNSKIDDQVTEEIVIDLETGKNWADDDSLSSYDGGRGKVDDIFDPDNSDKYKDIKPDIVSKKTTRKRKIKEDDPDYKLDPEELRKEEMASRPKVKKKTKRKLSVKQKRTPNSTQYKLQNLTKLFKENVTRVPIEPKDVRVWMEKERNSEYYRKLRLKCDLCVSSVDTIIKHKNKFHTQNETNSDPCTICHSFVPGDSLKRHRASHNFVYKCGVCAYECWRRHHMLSHLHTHRTVECLECGATFTCKRSYLDHFEATHKYCKCAECDKSFLSKEMLQKHIERHHTVPECKICNKTFAKYMYKRSHMATQHRAEAGERSYCVTCDKHFINPAKYNIHVRTNKIHLQEMGKTTKKPPPCRIKCTACPNVYKSRHAMRCHYIKHHTDEKRYYCSICDKIFIYKDKLKRHNMYVHEGAERPRDKICGFCGRGFSSKEILVNHIRTHTGEKPFKCPHCDASFAQKVAMRMHVKHIHKGIPRGHSKKEE